MQTRIEKIMGLKDTHPLLKSIESGERGLPSQYIYDGWYKQMIGRYMYASKFTKDKVVLDACCGVGWGAYMLASNAKKIYATDQNADCIKFIESYWNDSVIVPLHADIFNLELDEKVDVITLMEAIEHFDKEDGIRLLTKLCENLKDNGIVILSSGFPKSREKADKLCAQNLFHHHIYTKQEMKIILAGLFENVIMKGRKIFCCSNKRTKQEKISILIANYNNEKYISACLDSLLTQTNQNWEAYIVDDCSTDSSRAVLDQYKSDKIKIFHSDVNVGYAGTLKKLVDLSENDIVGIVDSDDALYPNAVDVILGYYSDNSDAAFVYSKYHKCNVDLLKPSSGFSKAIPEGKTNLNGWCVSHFKTFRKSTYYKTEGFDPTIECAVDKDLALKMEEVTKLHFVDEVLYKWRKTGNSLSTGVHRKKKLNHFLSVIVNNAKARRK